MTTSLITPRGKDTLQAVRRNGFLSRATGPAIFCKPWRLNPQITHCDQWRTRGLDGDALAGADVPVVINALDNLPGSFDGLGTDNARCSMKRVTVFSPAVRHTMHESCDR